MCAVHTLIVVAAGPLIVVAALLWVADRRARKLEPPSDQE